MSNSWYSTIRKTSNGYLGNNVQLIGRELNTALLHENNVSFKLRYVQMLLNYFKRANTLTEDLII